MTGAIGTKPGAATLLTSGILLARKTDAPLRLVSLVAVDRPGGDPATLRRSTEHAQEVLSRARARLPEGLPVTAQVASGPSIEQAVPLIVVPRDSTVTVGE